MIVTLAGHVDHGKTSLVRALTGVDTDRLEQEKQRGLTIDLGFAYIDDGNIGFVDVPGHHKFIHNMVAGVASQQHALLVIAADDGPMPQSKEHLEILSLVGIRSGIIALTKCDRVDATRIELCREEIAELVQGSFLEDAPIINTSIEDSDSIAALLSHLRDKAADYEQDDTQAPFRLAIDRTFSVRGAGLVVTGTVHSGHVKVDDSLYHFPSQTSVRVRSIRAQDQNVEQAHPGDRCALNLSGLDLEAVNRGDWVCAEIPPRFLNITVQANVLADFPRAVKHWTPVHIYHATSHTTGRIALLDDQRIAPGMSAMIDLVCDEPLSVRHGDQLVLRDRSLDVTLGGATVIHASAKHTRRRRNDERLQMLGHFNADNAETCFTGLLKVGPVALESFQQIWHLTNAQLEQILAAHDVLKAAGLAISRTFLGQLQKMALQQVKAHQKENPSSPGLKENSFKQMPRELRQRLLNAMVQAQELENVGGHYRLPAHQAELPEALQNSWQRLEPALNQKQAPSTGDLAKQWNTPQQQLEADLKELTKRGYVTHIANHRYYLPSQLSALAEEVKRLSSDKALSVKEFRDTTGIGRNVAIEVLEYFDRRGFTRRQGNERVVLKDNF